MIHISHPKVWNYTLCCEDEEELEIVTLDRWEEATCVTCKETVERIKKLDKE